MDESVNDCMVHVVCIGKIWNSLSDTQMDQIPKPKPKCGPKERKTRIKAVK